jgi:outer membrane biosynthesis protein TonB
VRICIDESGQITSVDPLTSDSAFKEATQRHVQNWTFRSHQYDGRSISACGKVKVHSNCDKHPQDRICLRFR